MASLIGDTHNLFTFETPNTVRTPGLNLLTLSSPNGQKVQILLEELAEFYGADKVNWTTTKIDVLNNEHKEDWFLRLNPNGRIPILVDNQDDQPFPVMESSAEMLYLVDKYDTQKRFWFEEPAYVSEGLQWLFFWHGNGAPIQGQLGHFVFAKEQVPYAIDRFRNELLRVFGVLELRLSGRNSREDDGGIPRQYLVGPSPGKYSLADMGAWPWVKKWRSYKEISGEDMAQFPYLLEWIARIEARPSVVTAIGDKYMPREDGSVK